MKDIDSYLRDGQAGVDEMYQDFRQNMWDSGMCPGIPARADRIKAPEEPTEAIELLKMLSKLCDRMESLKNKDFIWLAVKNNIENVIAKTKLGG